MTKRGLTPAEQLVAKTARDPETGCLNWTGALSPKGYGQLSVQRDGVRTYMLPHRVAYEQAKGQIPDGLQVDHLCRNRRCCNPDHLEAVTPRENTLRSPAIPSAKNAQKTHCNRGHEFTPENTLAGNGRRECRTCKRERERRYDMENPERRQEWRAKANAKRRVPRSLAQGEGDATTPEHAPDCQSHIVDVRGRPDPCTCGAAPGEGVAE